MSTRWRLAALTALFALVTACGSGQDGGKDDGVASLSGENTPSSGRQQPEGSEVDQMRAYAKCMREHGIDMADPEVSGGGIGLSIEGGDKEKVDQADKACRKLLPNGGVPPKPSAEDLDRMLAEAKCLREHGIDVDDPTMEEPGIRINGDGDGADKDKVEKAMAECGDGEGTVSHSEGGDK